MMNLGWRNKYLASTIPKLYEEFISSTSSKIEVINPPAATRSKKEKSSPIQKVILPRFVVQRSSYSHLLSGRWKNKPLLLNIDPSAMMGITRLMVRNCMKKQIYQGISEPTDIVNKMNPAMETSLEEIQFSSEVFFMSDKDFSHIEDEEQLKISLAQVYDSQPQRAQKRLQQEYNVPLPLVGLVQDAFLNNNPIYFAGVNEYALRNVLCCFYSLNDLKTLFIDCLKYSSANSNEFENFHLYAREFITGKSFDVLIPIQVSLLKDKLKMIGEGVVMAHSYVINSFDIQKKIVRKNLLESSADLESDEKRIEKHAILEALLGTLWSQPYTMNKFPYLTEQYQKLGDEDKQFIKNTYIEHLTKYKGGIRLFFQKLKAKNH